MILDFRPAIVAIVKDISRGRRAGEISACFHNTLSAAIVEVCGRIRSSDGLDRVCLSGGTFQNLYLLESNGGRVAASRLWRIPARPGSGERRRHFTGAGRDRERAFARRRLTCVWRYPARW